MGGNFDKLCKELDVTRDMKYGSLCMINWEGNGSADEMRDFLDY